MTKKGSKECYTEFTQEEDSKTPLKGSKGKAESKTVKAGKGDQKKGTKSEEKY